MNTVQPVVVKEQHRLAQSFQSSVALGLDDTQPSNLNLDLQKLHTSLDDIAQVLYSRLAESWVMTASTTCGLHPY